MKHKCGKRDSSIAPLFLFSFFGPFFIILAFLFLGNALIMMTITLSLQHNDYNSKLEQDMTLYECLRRCTRWCNESRVTCIMLGGFATNTMSTTRSCNGNMTKVMHVMMMVVEVAWQYISEWLWKCHDR